MTARSNKPRPLDKDHAEAFRLGVVAARQKKLAELYGLNDFRSWFFFWEMHKGQHWAFKRWPKVPGEPK